MGETVERLDVIGNISRDLTRYPDHRGGSRLGGAALFVSLAAAKSGLRAAPVCVLGNDLAHLPETPGLDALDWSARLQADGTSTTFDLEYDLQGELMRVDTEYGVAENLTEHALRHVDAHPRATFHVCCRRPLDVAAVLGRLTANAADFSVDFFLPSAEAMIRAAAPWLPKATTLFLNTAEYRLLEQAIDCGNLPEVVVTDGSRAAVVRNFGRQSASAVPPPNPAHEVSGAGDTLAGTFLAHRSRGATTAQALAEATAAATRYVAAPTLPIPAPRRG
ncbi:carbohydrate kinase family protein [Streptomyces sp. NBC_00654]|uniref:PfkB family carbohydrate kinase n=1 Tax=Streptomyces sp. NBC_00654 TaxID=2975799 RepID=UPI00224EA51C|nr:PfkB family carbohydrate kinase [Streptomyces sp. NBC_00654]MCX4966335.1 carbohydrate kinase family protein [Streptomyces sp. NBC_00654]